MGPATGDKQGGEAGARVVGAEVTGAIPSSPDLPVPVASRRRSAALVRAEEIEQEYGWLRQAGDDLTDASTRLVSHTHRLCLLLARAVAAGDVAALGYENFAAYARSLGLRQSWAYDLARAGRNLIHLADAVGIPADLVVVEARTLLALRDEALPAIAKSARDELARHGAEGLPALVSGLIRKNAQEARRAARGAPAHALAPPAPDADSPPALGAAPTRAGLVAGVPATDSGAPECPDQLSGEPSTAVPVGDPVLAAARALVGALRALRSAARGGVTPEEALYDVLEQDERRLALLDWGLARYEAVAGLMMAAIAPPGPVAALFRSSPPRTDIGDDDTLRRLVLGACSDGSASASAIATRVITGLDGRAGASATLRGLRSDGAAGEPPYVSLGRHHLARTAAMVRSLVDSGELRRRGDTYSIAGPSSTAALP